jgi:type 2 lantibiotic biosynthesis protein LanM
MASEINAARERDLLRGDSPQERYRSFFIQNSVLTQDARRLPQRYPRLFSAIETVCATSALNTVRCIQRLREDYTDLQAFCGESLGHLTKVLPSGSDRHRGGTQVLFAEFSSGGRVVYKPRDLRPDQALANFVERLELPSYHEMILPRVLVRRDYGWAEFIPFRTLQSTAEARLYYQRAGAVLAVSDLAGFTDGHFENLIACGPYPVIVDCETPFQSQREDEGYGPREERSILATGLLQNLDAEQKGRGVLAALQVAGSRRHYYLYPHPINERTDELQVRFQGSRTEACFNFPVFDDYFESPRDHEDSLVDGMLAVYEHAIARRDQLLNDRTLWQSMAKVPVRQLIRATMFYLLLLRRLEQPEAAASLEAANATLDLGLGAKIEHRVNALVNYEKQELLACDIPVFYAQPGRRDLVSGRGDRYPGFYRTTAVDQIRGRLASLGRAYCQRQAEIVRYHLPLAPSRHLVPQDVIPSMRARGAEI